MQIQMGHKTVSRNADRHRHGRAGDRMPPRAAQEGQLPLASCQREMVHRFHDLDRAHLIDRRIEKDDQKKQGDHGEYERE